MWGTDPFERVLTAEVRGTVDDVVTLAVDAADTRKLDAETRYKLVTMPVESRPDREFASVLRAADETMAAVTVADGSPLVGQPVGAIDVTVVAIRPREGPVEPLPARDRILTADDALYLVAAPEAIRKVEQAASSAVGGPTADPTVPTAGSGAELAPDEQVDATTPVAGESPDRDGATRAVDDRESAPDGSADLPADGAPGSGTATAPAESADAPFEPADSTDVGAPSEPSESADVDDLSDADAPGIRTLEADQPDGNGERAAAATDDSAPASGSGDDPSDGKPTREDLDDLAGVDVDDLTGTDVAVDADGEPDEQPNESADGADVDDPVDEPTVDEPAVDESAADDPTDDEEFGEADDADGEEFDSDDSGDDGGWTVAVDERRDADADR
ncbi:TrkA C-terminal domain-containing protein [Halosimplex aquaticum]